MGTALQVANGPACLVLLRFHKGHCGSPRGILFEEFPLFQKNHLNFSKVQLSKADWVSQLMLLMQMNTLSTGRLSFYPMSLLLTSTAAK